MPGIGRHLGQEPSLLTAARLALALGGPEERWNRPKKAVPALHREAERDTTGSNSRQHPVHTWIGHSVQAKRRGPATLILIHKMRTKTPLRSR